MTAGPESPVAVGLLLAAGAGRRMGTPKALLRTADGEPWLTRTARVLQRGGCARVVVVLGAAYAEARRLLPDDAEVVRAEHWQAGMGESLRAGLRHLAGDAAGARAAVVTLVDLPDVGPEVVGRLLSTWARHERPTGALVRAVYGGRPGHPVVLGLDHWDAVQASVSGDVGAQSYLARVDVRRRVETVECSDLATGEDVDVPPRSEA